VTFFMKLSHTPTNRIDLMRTAWLFVGILVLLMPHVLNAQQDTKTKRVLVLYWDNKEFPGNVSFDQGFLSGLLSDPHVNVEYYPEYLDSNRFPGEQHSLLFHDYLRQKYADRPMDVVVALADPSLNFLLKYRADLFSNCPIVFVAVTRPSSEQITEGVGVTGLLQVSTHRPTLDLALKLHPDTKQVFVVSGTPEHDKRFETVARQELTGFEDRIKITYLTDVPVGELVERTKSLPPSSLILYLWQRSSIHDEEVLETYDVLRLIAATSSAPIYGMGSRNVGAGLVGGYVQGSESNGAKAAEVVRSILDGTRAQDIPIENAPAVPMFDWRQLRRWGISESSLPTGSVISFKELTIWDLYKWRIIGVITLIALQTLFITGLLIERRRRRRAKAALAKLNVELEERIAARTAALHAKSQELETFAYSVAHDLKAPLRGIDGYSRLLLEDHADSLNDEGRLFLKTISASSEEMSQLIEDLLAYSRLERRELKTNQLELKPLIRDVVAQKKSEMGDDKIDFVVNVNGGTVLADEKGLAQALKNYVDNAIKFTRLVSHPRIEIGSEDTPRGCLIWVRDNGVGFDMQYQDRIFNIFERLNTSDEFPGTGIGLAIVRKAMERMGGRAWAQSQPGQGATFYLEIPRSI
jgi:signal transduction histidine kinase